MELQAQIKEIVATLDVAGSPGGVVAIARKGIVELAVPFGYANLEHAVPNTRETVFYIASTSKQFVAAAIALLEADGALSPDEPIATWLPEVEELGDIRVQHLVHHTSGIRDKYSLAALGALPEEYIATEAGTMRLLARQRSLNFAPGSRMMYSNSGYALLATLVERVAGQSFVDFTNERLFLPAGMTDTRFRSDPNEVIAQRASGYAPRPGGGWKDAEYTWSALGPGGVVSTVDSLARWALVYQANPLSPKDLAERLQVTVPFTDGSPAQYAYGVMLDEHNGDRLLHHAGGVPGFSAEMLQLPSQELTIICLSNTSAGGAPQVARKVLELLDPVTRGGADGVSKAARSPIALEDAVGSYIDEDESNILRFTAEADQATITLGAQTIPVEQGEDGELNAMGFELTLDDGCLVLTHPTQTMRFMRVTPAPSLAAEGLVGCYRSDELEVTITIAETDAGLTITWPTGVTAPLTPFSPDIATFPHESGLVVAVRILSVGGIATGLRISVTRALGTEFTKIS